MYKTDVPHSDVVPVWTVVNGEVLPARLVLLGGSAAGFPRVPNLTVPWTRYAFCHEHAREGRKRTFWFCDLELDLIHKKPSAFT